MMHEILSAARDYARQPDTTYPALRRFIEVSLENADRAATAGRGNVALDSVPRTSHFGDPECLATADAIWAAVQTPDWLPFFSGKPYNVGLRDYQASIGPMKGKGAYGASVLPEAKRVAASHIST
jgi:hypothetical protein